MKITVDRTNNPEGDLVFTITVKEPHISSFSEEEYLALKSIDLFTNNMAATLFPSGKLYQDIINANHNVKEKVFLRVLENLKFAIKHQLELKFNPICQEIYNWIYDHQEGFVKSWLQEFDPQRTTYYFDNDVRMEQNKITTEFPVDKDDEEDEDYDDDE